MRWNHGARMAVGLALFVVVGCGGGRGDLSGAVTYKGKPVESGSVTAAGSDGLPKTAFISDGRYEVRDLPAGPIRLSVSSPDPGQAPRRSLKGGPPLPKGDRTGWFPLPEKYGDLATSGLTAELAAGSSSHNIELK